MNNIVVKFDNLERTIPYINDYKTFKKEIKKLFCFSKEEFNITFLLYNENSKLQFKIANENDYSNLIQLLFYFPIKIANIEIKINPKYETIEIKKIDDVLERTNNMEKSEKITNKSIPLNRSKIKKIPSNLKLKNKKEEESILLLLNCNFIDNNNKNNHTITVKKNEINQYQPIEYYFRINNNGQQEWPNDTFLKCENDDTEIYFYYVSINDDEVEPIPISQNEIFQRFKVRILFKNYRNIKIGEYKLRASLISDKLGKIGNEYGILIVNVIK